MCFLCLEFFSAVSFLFVFDLMPSVPNRAKIESGYINSYKQNHVNIRSRINETITCNFVKKGQGEERNTHLPLMAPFVFTRLINSGTTLLGPTSPSLKVEEPLFWYTLPCVQRSVYVNPQIGTNSISIRGVPIWDFFCLPAHFHTGNPYMVMGRVVLTHP